MNNEINPAPGSLRQGATSSATGLRRDRRDTKRSIRARTFSIIRQHYESFFLLSDAVG